MMDGFRTSITDIRSLIKTVTLFFNEIGTGLVTGWTGSTLNVAEYDFPAYICFSAVISVNAEVVSVKEGSFYDTNRLHDGASLPSKCGSLLIS